MIVKVIISRVEKIILYIILILLNSNLFAQNELNEKDNVKSENVFKDSINVFNLANENYYTINYDSEEFNDKINLKCYITRISEDTIIFKREYNFGKIDSVDKQYLYFSEENGESHKFRLSLIEDIRFIDEENEKLSSMGIVSGYPTIFNMVYSIRVFNRGQFGMGILLGVLEKNLIWYPCARANVFYNVISNKNLEYNFGICVSTPIDSFIEKSQRSAEIENAYIGFYNDINYYNFYLSLGVGINPDYNSIVLFNLGYLYRFNF